MSTTVFEHPAGSDAELSILLHRRDAAYVNAQKDLRAEPVGMSITPGAPLRLILIVQSHDILSKVCRGILYTLLCLFRSNLERPEEIC